MDKYEILEALQSLEDSGMVCSEKGDTIVQLLANGTFRMKTAFGYLYYTPEELAEELAGWDDEIYKID